MRRIWTGRQMVVGRRDRGMGALRDELLAQTDSANRDTVMAAFDLLGTDDAQRENMVRIVQRYLKRVASYDRAIDGDWGEHTEDSYLRLYPSARGSLTRLVDLIALARASAGSVEMSHALAAGISRDRYLESTGADPSQEAVDEDTEPYDWPTADAGPTSDEAPEEPQVIDDPRTITALAIRPYGQRPPSVGMPVPETDDEGPVLDLGPLYTGETAPSAPSIPGETSSSKTVAVVAVIVGAVVIGGAALLVSAGRRRSRAPAGLGAAGDWSCSPWQKAFRRRHSWWRTCRCRGVRVGSAQVTKQMMHWLAETTTAYRVSYEQKFQTRRSAQSFADSELQRFADTYCG